MTTLDTATASPKELIAEITKTQILFQGIEKVMRDQSARIDAMSPGLSTMLSVLRTRFGINQADLQSPKLTRSRVARLESGKDVWTSEDIESYMAALSKIISDRANAFNASLCEQRS